MTSRRPLIVNTSANQIQELDSADSLYVTSINVAGTNANLPPYYALAFIMRTL